VKENRAAARISRQRFTAAEEAQILEEYVYASATEHSAIRPAGMDLSSHIYKLA
jgi:hypothetical protein